MLSSVESLREKLRDGIPELEVPSIEPMILDKITLSDSNNFRAIAQNVKLHGLSNFQAKFLHVDLENKRLDIDLIFKKVKLNADYNVNARIVVPIGGTGPIDIVADDVTAKVTLKYQLVDHKGKKYLYFPSITIKLNIKDYTSHFMPKEGPDSPLANGINSALSTSREEIIETITPNLEKVISERVLMLSNRICKHFTYDELFPENI